MMGSGLCSKEINYYIKIAPPNIFEWLDIANNPGDLKKIKVSQYDALSINGIDIDF